MLFPKISSSYWIPVSALSIFLASISARAVSAVSASAEESYCQQQKYSDILMCGKYKTRDYYASAEFAKYQQQRSCQGLTGENPQDMANDCRMSIADLQRLYGAMYENAVE
jgi:hypothetical protein